MEISKGLRQVQKKFSDLLFNSKLLFQKAPQTPYLFLNCTKYIFQISRIKQVGKDSKKGDFIYDTLITNPSPL
jgi:hypothetical protein